MSLNLERNKKYILGCSFGPDSMALFDMLLKENYRFVVCNINYNHRDISSEETEQLKAYCKEKNIEFYSKSVLFPGKNLNFESWARDIRYEFFFEKAKELNIDSILIAHNEDDLLETYYLQKERSGFVSYYGLKEETYYGEIAVIRPLLNYTKKELNDYCISNNIPFSIDKTNFDLTLKRNYYRHEVIAKLSKEEKINLRKEIKDKNLNKELKILSIKRYIKGFNILKSDLINLSLDDAQLAIILLVNKKGYHEISKDFVRDLRHAITKNAKSWSYKFNDGLCLRFNYEYVTLIDINLTYEEIINKDSFESENFKINPNSTFYEKIKNSAYFVIKPCQSSLFYKNLEINKRCSRWFIDWKMPWELRHIWPGIYNEKGELLYVPKYQKEPKVTQNSLLLFNLEKIFENK